jgi:hypothetical protein
MSHFLKVDYLRYFVTVIKLANAILGREGASGVRIQGLVHTRQALYHRASFPGPPPRPPIKKRVAW